MRSIRHVFPSDKLQIERPFIREATAETLFGEDTQFDLSHVEPRGVCRRIVKAEPSSNPVGLVFAEGFDPSKIGMGVEIVQDDINTGRFRVQDIDQIPHGIGEILFGAAACDEGMALARFGFGKDEHIPRAVPLVFVVFTPGMTRADGNGRTGLLEQLQRLLIETNHGAMRVIQLMIQRQDVLHFRQEHRGDLGDTPTSHLPRLNLFFFRISRTVSGAICSTSPSAISR